MKCKVCRGAAVIDVPRHNAAFCGSHFVKHFHDQVARAIKQFNMFGTGDRLLVAVSGGKDSLALWDVLLELGYEATGLYLDLGIGGYSSRSQEAALAFARFRDAELRIRSLHDAHGYSVPELARLTGRVPCSGCGLNKRYELNRAALEEDFDVLVTGHNLDDEAATLLGNVLHWNADLLGRQGPVLEERVLGEGGEAERALVRKVKPLVRLAERETAAYAFIRGIDYIVEECPMAEGNTHHRYKDALTLLEESSPGTKHQMYFGYLKRAADRFAGEAGAPALVACALCGAPTVAGKADRPTSSFCKTKQLAARNTERAGKKPSNASTR